MSDRILIGVAPEGPHSGPQELMLRRANRHGLVAGATGTGKTVTLQTLAEAFSRAGVAVFAADVKGDLSGIAVPGEPPPKWAASRATDIGLADFRPEAPPVTFWDLYGEQGHPVRTTISEMGPLLLGRILDCSDAQEGALTIAFKLADDEDLLLLDLRDLRQVLTHIAENADEIGRTYGLVSPQTVAALQRKLLQLEMDGADKLFGEPALDLNDLIRTTPDGRGVVNVLVADKLIRTPKLYATFLLWLMSELFEELPEVGDLDKPKLVFFFDEAHLLFDGAPKELLDRIEQVARLIRSKGVGIYFVTQSPTDVPDIVLAQLGNRVQHALRAYTPADQKAVKAAAASFRAAEGLDVVSAIQELKVGEALVSTLDAQGAPTPVARTLIAPPRARVGPLLPGERAALLQQSPFTGKYDKPVDRESAYEVLNRRTQAAAEAAARAEANAARDKGRSQDEPRRSEPRAASRPSAVERTVTKVGGRVASNVLNTVARELMRGIFGTRRRR